MNASRQRNDAVIEERPQVNADHSGAPVLVKLVAPHSAAGSRPRRLKIDFCIGFIAIGVLLQIQILHIQMSSYI